MKYLKIKLPHLKKKLKPPFENVVIPNLSSSEDESFSIFYCLLDSCSSVGWVRKLAGCYGEGEGLSRTAAGSHKVYSSARFEM